MNNQTQENDSPSDANDQDDKLPSKSQLKRDALQAFELAKALLQLSHSKRDRLQLTTEITDALVLADGIRSNGARKRQLQYIGKLLRGSADYESYRLRFENPKLTAAPSSATDAPSAELARDMHMRDRLLDDLPATMDDLRSQYPNANIQLIRQLVNRITKSGDQTSSDSSEPQMKLLQSLGTALQEGRS